MTDLDDLLYTPAHEWVRLDGDTATFGITDHAAGQLGDVVFVDLPTEGAELALGAVCGEVESTKSVGELFTPVAGRVVAVNAEVAADPSLVNADPFGAGWLVRVEIEGAAPSDLLDRAAYVALTDAAA